MDYLNTYTYLVGIIIFINLIIAICHWSASHLKRSKINDESIYNIENKGNSIISLDNVEFKQRFITLEKTINLLKIEIISTQKTLALCLEKAPTSNIAFSIYSKLLAAYEVLLDNNLHENNNYITPVLSEKLEIAATLVSSNKQYVPEEIIRFMLEEMHLPYEVRGILWGKS